MEKAIYEKEYKNPKHFSFGRNWQQFLKTIDESKIKKAEESLVNFLGEENKIKGKTFVDVGCGSGLFSLAALRLGAEKVVSVDVDDFSIACAKYLKEQAGIPPNWEIRKGSALNAEFINSLGKFDIVYSWGVLHHTGDMRRAIKNTVKLLGPGGVFYLAIYNNSQRKLEGTSDFWLKIKRFYNQSNSLVKKSMEIVYFCYLVLGLLANFKNPINHIRNYSTLRGMDFFTDLRDWLGGYPYEYASVQEIKRYLEKLNLACEKSKAVRSIGCNEFLFRKSL